MWSRYNHHEVSVQLVEKPLANSSNRIAYCQTGWVSQVELPRGFLGGRLLFNIFTNDLGKGIDSALKKL